MRKKAITTTKQAFEIGKITKIMQGHKGIVRVDAVVRNYNAYPDQDRFFSKWISNKYCDSLCQEYFGKNASEMNVYRY